MQLEQSRTEERILCAAVHLFASEGFHGTSTRDIARLADVNEVTVFRHFPTKRELFWAALESKIAKLTPDEQLLRSLADDDGIEEVIPRIVEFCARAIIEDAAVARLLQFGALESPATQHSIAHKHLARPLEAIYQYFERAILRGSIRETDPHVVTIAIMSALLAHNFFVRTFGEQLSEVIDADATAATYSRFWLEMLAPTH